MYYYRTYGLILASEIQFSAFQTIEATNSPDVRIILADTPKELLEENARTIVKKVRFQTAPNKLLYNFYENGRIYITDGDKISVTAPPSADWDYLKNHIRTRALAAILHQRRHAPIHGSAIAVDNKAVLFVGRSGAGKSTLAGAFIKKGYPYLADDFCVFEQYTNGDYQLQAAYPQLRLWQESIALLEAEETLIKGQAIRQGLSKFFIEPAANFHANSIPVQLIYILDWHIKAEVEIQTLNNIDALQLLIRHTFGKAQMDGLGGHKEQFQTLTHLMKTVVVKSIKRPHGLKQAAFWTMVEQIEQDFLS